MKIESIVYWIDIQLKTIKFKGRWNSNQSIFSIQPNRDWKQSFCLWRGQSHPSEWIDADEYLKKANEETEKDGKLNALQDEDDVIIVVRSNCFN